MTKSLVYYSDCKPNKTILEAVRRKISSISNGHEIISVTLEPVVFGKNITLPLERSRLSMFKQILRGLQEATSDIVFLTEHDILYNSSHFDFTPPRGDTYYYNENTWRVDSKTGQALFYYCKQVSGLCASRDLLLEHYTKRVERTEREGYNHKTGYEPGCHKLPNGIDNYPTDKWMSEVPLIDIRHGRNLTASRWNQSEFRNKNTCLGWTMADEVPMWGKTKGRFWEFLEEVT